MLEKDSLKSEGVSGLEFRSVTVLRNNAFRDISDTSIKEYLLKNLRVKPTYIVSTTISVVAAVVIIMSPNRRVPFKLCNIVN